MKYEKRFYFFNNGVPILAKYIRRHNSRGQCLLYEFLDSKYYGKYIFGLYLLT